MTETTANPPGNPEALAKFNRGKNYYDISPGNLRSLIRLKNGVKFLIFPANCEYNSYIFT